MRKLISAQCILAALIEYKNISKKTLQESIKSEMSGNLEKLLVAVGEQNVTSLARFYRHVFLIWALQINILTHFF